jgi:phosphoribosylanthranilate isomerase
MAQAATAAGADFLGFNFVPTSRRRITPERATEIIHGLVRRPQIVGVFQDAPLETVNQTVRVVGLDFVQLHGDESPEYAAGVEAPVIKAVSVNGRPVSELMDEMRRYEVPYFLLDRTVQGQGVMIDFDTARQLAEAFDVFVAGGLTPSNVRDIVRLTKPFAVDVAGGIERGGHPDSRLIADFVRLARTR